MNMPLNIDLQQIFLHMFNFAILCGGLYFILYKPVKEFMYKRVAYYQGMEKEATDRLENVKLQEAEYKKRLEQADAEIESKKSQAAKDAKKMTEMAVEDARKQKEHIIAEAQKEAKREKDRIIQEARGEIVQLAIAATAKMLQGEEVSHE